MWQGRGGREFFGEGNVRGLRGTLEASENAANETNYPSGWVQWYGEVGF